MRKSIEITPNNSSKKFQGPAKKGEVRNPKGRTKETEERKMARRMTRFQYASTKTGNQMKLTLYDLFQKSQASSILNCMFNMKLPPQLRPAGYVPGVTKVSLVEDSMIRSQLIKNFKWAVEQMVRLMPKELVGTVSGEVTLIGMVKRAVLEDKSSNVIDLVQKRREKEIYETEEQ